MNKPITKMKSIKSSLLKKMDVEEIMKFINHYHFYENGEGEKVFETKYGNVVVFSDEEAIYADWE